MTGRFVIVDNDAVNNLLCTLAIRDAAGEVEIQTFELPVKAFEYLTADINIENITVLFLDINMPIWSAWDFLNNFEKLEEKIKSKIKIYLLSSSIDANDKHRATENKNVVEYIEKPLSVNTVSSILTKWM